METETTTTEVNFKVSIPYRISTVGSLVSGFAMLSVSDTKVSIPYRISTVGSPKKACKDCGKVILRFNPLSYFYSRVTIIPLVEGEFGSRVFQSPIVFLQSGHYLYGIEGNINSVFQSPIVFLQSGHWQ